MDRILDALTTGAGMLWKALWALVFGYVISAAIQVFVSRKRMADLLGERGAKQAGLAGLFGLISSSCSFAALAASRSVLTKGAHPANALAFLIASTNLVIELGIVLLVLLGWHFLLGNVLVGILMLVYAYALTRIWRPGKKAEAARRHAEDDAKQRGGRDMSDVKELGALRSREGWQAIADAFFMEWKMVYKEILFGFTIAGVISVFVPRSFWDAIFLSAGGDAPSAWVVLENAALAPVVAFFTFIGSMGNVPLAAMLWAKGTSFGGVMSFLGADLVAATVVWIHAKYYGWKYAAYLSAILYVCMVAAGLTVHALFALLGILPRARPTLEEMVRFEIDYTFWLNIAFGVLALALVGLHLQGKHHKHERKRKEGLRPAHEGA